MNTNEAMEFKKTKAVYLINKNSGIFSAATPMVVSGATYNSIILCCQSPTWKDNIKYTFSAFVIKSLGKVHWIYFEGENRADWSLIDVVSLKQCLWRDKRTPTSCCRGQSNYVATNIPSHQCVTERFVVIAITDFSLRLEKNIYAMLAFAEGFSMK